MIKSGRDRILARLRAAPPAAGEPAPPPTPAAYFAPLDDPLARFQAECALNRTELHRVEAASAGEVLARLLLQEPARGGIFLQDDAPELHSLAAALPAPLRARLRWSKEGPAQASDIAAITLAETLVAHTGSILITAASGGRAASVLPPLHIVYAHESQLVAELEPALVQARLRRPGASMLCLITGPSRTADIEKLLVLGAHGPRRLALLLARA